MERGKIFSLVSIASALLILFAAVGSADSAIGQLEQITGQKIDTTTPETQSVPITQPIRIPPITTEPPQSPVTTELTPNLWTRFSQWAKNTFTPEKPTSPSTAAVAIETKPLQKLSRYNSLVARIRDRFAK